MAFHPAETLKKIPWEVWVGLLLTIAVAWIATRQAVSAGQASAQPTDVGVGTPSGQPTNVTPVGAASTTDLGTLSQQIGDLTASNQAALQQLSNLAGGMGGYPGSATNSGAIGTPQNGLPFRTAPVMSAGGDTGTGGLVGTGSSAQGAHAAAAASSSGLAQNGGGGGGGIPGGHGPGGAYDAARQAAADIGSHQGIDSSGSIITIQSTYANMTDAEKDMANTFAHQYPNGKPGG